MTIQFHSSVSEEEIQKFYERDYMKEVDKMFAEDSVPIEPKKQVNWEKLCHDLEDALTDEIEENHKLQIENEILRKESDSIVEYHKYQRNVISYLESKLGYDSV